MPPLPSPGKVIKMQVSGVNEGGEFTNIHHISYVGVQPTVADLTALHGAIDSSYATIFVNNAADTLTELNYKYTDLDSDTGAVYEASQSIAPTLAGVVVSINNAVCVSWEILRRYRGGHPRSYLPLGTGSTLEGTSTINWQASFIANVQANCISFMNAVNAYSGPNIGQCSLVNVSYYSGNARRVTPVIDVIQTAIARTRVCSQRRRLGKVGG
jgi:hypothetical protein